MRVVFRLSTMTNLYTVSTFFTLDVHKLKYSLICPVECVDTNKLNAINFKILVYLTSLPCTCKTKSNYFGSTKAICGL